MKILLCKQGEEAIIIEIDNDLSAFQQTVGGYIECITLSPDLVAICNEDGKLIEGALPNRWCRGDVIYGDFFFAGADEDEFCDVPEKYFAQLKALYGAPQYDKEGERVLCFRPKVKS